MGTVMNVAFRAMFPLPLGFGPRLWHSDHRDQILAGFSVESPRAVEQARRREREVLTKLLK
jgi:hypothetical protein